MVSNMQIDMIAKLNMVAATKSSDWWLDFGATIHVCNVKSFFNAYEKAKDDEEVLMGNSNYAKVLRKGSIELQFTFGKKLTLMNVFYVPEIRKNLVSTNLLCKSGMKLVLESDKLINSNQFWGFCWERVLM